MLLMRKIACATLYLVSLLALMYGATLLVFILAAWLSASGVVLFLLGIGIGALSAYLFFRVTLRYSCVLTHAALRKLAAIVFAVLGLLFSLVAALLVILMQRSENYDSLQIAEAVTPPLVWIALCMGLIAAYRIAHHRLK